MKFNFFLLSTFFLVCKNVLGNPNPENDIHFHIDLQKYDEDRIITGIFFKLRAGAAMGSNVCGFVCQSVCRSVCLFMEKIKMLNFN